MPDGQLEMDPIWANDPRSGKRLSAADRWALVMAERPEVFRAFERYTFEAIGAGRARVGAKAVWERMRWQSYVTTGGEDFKLDNTLVSHAARTFQEKNPEQASVFETRRSRHG